MKFHWIIWIPRILMPLLAMFMIVFSIEAAGMQGSIWQKALFIFLRSIPSLIILSALIITWNEPFTGSIFFFALCAMMTIYFKLYQNFYRFLIFAVPSLLTGVLFMIAHVKKLKELAKSANEEAHQPIMEATADEPD